MGRKSADAATLTVVAGNFGGRPEPSAGLTEAQAAIWRETCASEASDFFRTSALRELLRDYCCHKTTAMVLTKEIDAFQPEWLSQDGGPERLDRLTKMRERETKAAGDKATKLRLTNQSRYTPQAAATAAKNASTTRKPWEQTG